MVIPVIIFQIEFWIVPSINPRQKNRWLALPKGITPILAKSFFESLYT